MGKTLEDIRLELLDIPDLDGVDQGKPKKEQQEQDGEKWSVGVEGGGNKADHTYEGDRPAEPSFQYPEQSLVNSAHIYSLIHSESGNKEAHSHGIKFPIVEEGK